METRRWLGVLALCGLTAFGCATGQNADPNFGDDDGAVDDDTGKKNTDDTGDKSPDDAGNGDDAVAVDETPTELDAGAPDGGAIDGGGVTDGGTMDAGTPDVGMDAGVIDTGPRDTGVIDMGPPDTGVIDTGVIDTGPVDTGVDLGPPDTGPVDTGTPDTGPTIMCPSFPFSTHTCSVGADGTAPCCLNLGGIAAGCGCAVPIFGCLPCN